MSESNDGTTIERRGSVKHAVVVIHGMGEQHPMSTLRGFVKSLWERNPDIISHSPKTENAREVWVKPDRTAGSFELQRVTTRSARGRNEEAIRLDFYEFYWAHHTAGTTLKQLRDWVMTLLLRRPSTVPSDVFHVWCLLWFSAGLALLFSLAPLVDLPIPFTQSWPTWLFYAASLFVISILPTVMLPYFGDVARYVRPAPENIEIRHDIRDAGVNFLRRLNDAEHASGKKRYERITLVGHSLGSIIAYDLLIHFWADRAQKLYMEKGRAGTKALETIEAMEKLIPQLKEKAHLIDGLKARIEPRFEILQRFSDWIGGLKNANPAVNRIRQIEKSIEDEEAIQKSLANQYHSLQRSLFEEIRNFQPAWNISDFISIGSPLTHAEFLLAVNEEKFRKRVAERSLSACPPVLEEVRYQEGHSKKTKKGFSYQPNRSESEAWLMNHASVFAPVRWTNIYDDDFLIAYGDIISGSVGPLFGPAVEDIKVRIWRQFFCGRFFTHTSYWTWLYDDGDDPPAHVRTLQRALFEDVFPDRAEPDA